MNRVFAYFAFLFRRRMSSRTAITALCCAMAFALAGCLGEDGSGTRTDPVDQDLPRLFSDASAGMEPAKTYPEEIRARLLAINPAFAAEGGESLSGAQRFLLNLFEDAVFTAEVDRAETAEPGRFTLNGHLAGAEGSYFILSYSQGAVSITAFHPGRGYWDVEPSGQGGTKVSEFKPGKLPRITHGMIYPEGLEHIHGDPVVPALPKVAAAGPSTIDIMVVYTAAAVTGSGGDAAMRAKIDKAIAEANNAFVNSKIDTKLNLVRAQQVAYSESGNMGTDLSRLQNKTDGYMDDVHSLRETYKADLVSLVVENAGGGGVAGIGYVMTSVTNGFKAYAFTTVGRKYTGSYNTMAHEIGHNLGCAHDRQNSSSPAAYPYSYGYRFTANGVQYRDIMAYAPGTPIPYFSNPGVLYLGAATGIPDGQANSADNARTINNTSPTAQAFFAGTTPVPVVKTALLITGTATLANGDLAVSNRLQSHGYTVTVKSGPASTTADATGKTVVVISSTIASADVNTKFRAVAVPVVNWEQALQDDFGMTDGLAANQGTTASQTQVVMSATHPIAAGLTGTQSVATAAGAFAWGKPNANAAAVANQAGDATRRTIYAYEKGAAMPGLAAPARRVQLFLTDGTASGLTTAGWSLFDNAVKWAAGL